MQQAAHQRATRLVWIIKGHLRLLHSPGPRCCGRPLARRLRRGRLLCLLGHLSLYAQKLVQVSQRLRYRGLAAGAVGSLICETSAAHHCSQILLLPAAAARRAAAGSRSARLVGLSVPQCARRPHPAPQSSSAASPRRLGPQGFRYRRSGSEGRHDQADRNLWSLIETCHQPCKRCKPRDRLAALLPRRAKVCSR